ncbi:hypothetical protein [Polyangium spumosum]|uniref:Uncharacterized protein n=1 Tax=Polyangium spumosum TaxID=889282 RepID=A0A6N7PYG2_9BACT|nr:hypothetical protein [Polyangium spumosum]MRG96939.1 hypothetical protein [Polyangium spumosum]
MLAADAVLLAADVLLLAADALLLAGDAIVMGPLGGSRRVGWGGSMVPDRLA